MYKGLEMVDISKLGFSKWGFLSKDSGVIKFSRIDENWLPRLPYKMNFRAKTCSGLSFDFISDTKKLVIRYKTEQSPDDAGLDIFIDKKAYSHTRITFNKKDHIKTVYYDLDKNVEREISIILPIGELELKDVWISKNAIIRPLENKQPAICFYGDSITHGAKATTGARTYPFKTAKYLDVSAINMGFGGSGYPIHLMAVYLSTKLEWDMLVIAIGTNSYSSGCESAYEFGLAYDLFLEIIRNHHAIKPVFCMMPIWYATSDDEGIRNTRGNVLQDYRDSIKKVVNKRQKHDNNLYLINGVDFINDPTGLSDDKCHPNDLGMDMIAKGLAEKINSKSVENKPGL